MVAASTRVKERVGPLRITNLPHSAELREAERGRVSTI